MINKLLTVCRYPNSLNIWMLNILPLSYRWSEQPWQLLADTLWSWADAEEAEEPEVWAEGTPWHNLCGKTQHKHVSQTNSCPFITINWGVALYSLYTFVNKGSNTATRDGMKLSTFTQVLYLRANFRYLFLTCVFTFCFSYKLFLRLQFFIPFL